jgi:hypothetical protein
LLSQVFVYAENRPIGRGDRFPGVNFRNNLSNDERFYLGLSRKKTFSLNDIDGTLFFVEVFSTYCVSCPKNAPVLNSIYSAAKNDPGLKDRVKILSIAVGNTSYETESFKKEYNILYPVITDMHFAAHKALGNPRVPYSLLIRKTNKGTIVVDTHQGVIDSADALLGSIRGFILK